jgi:hypothetical protein
LIIGCEQNHGKAHIAMRFNFLNDGPALVSLLVQDNGAKAEAFQKSCDGFASPFVMPMNYENGGSRGLLLHHFGHLGTRLGACRH